MNKHSTTNDFEPSFAGIWLFWRDDGMKIYLVSRASNLIVYEGGKESGLDEVLRIESRKGFVRPQRKERLLTRVFRMVWCNHNVMIEFNTVGIG